MTLLLICFRQPETKFLPPHQNHTEGIVTHLPGAGLTVPRGARAAYVHLRHACLQGRPSFPPHLWCVPFSLRLRGLTHRCPSLRASRPPVLEGLPRLSWLCSSAVHSVEGGHGVTRGQLHDFHSLRGLPRGGTELKPTCSESLEKALCSRSGPVGCHEPQIREYP